MCDTVWRESDALLASLAGNSTGLAGRPRRPQYRQQRERFHFDIGLVVVVDAAALEIDRPLVSARLVVAAHLQRARAARGEQQLAARRRRARAVDCRRAKSACVAAAAATAVSAAAATSSTATAVARSAAIAAATTAECCFRIGQPRANRERGCADGDIAAAGDGSGADAASQAV